MNRNLNLLLGGQLVSQVGDKFHMLAVAFMVLKTTGSPAKMGLVLFCSIFPGMILGIVAGAVLDRYSRKGMIVIADVVRGIIVLAMSLLYAANCLTFSLLLLTQVLISVCTAFFDPAIPALLPQIVKQEELTRERLRDGWLHTGDMGYLDEEGYLFLADRIKDMINNAGLINRVAPMWEIPAEEFDRVLEVNLRGMGNVLRAFRAGHRQQGRRRHLGIRV